MAREHGRVNVEIWSDPEFRKLAPAAQHLYLLLWTSPALTYCGTHDWRPGRLAALSGGSSAELVEAAGACLAARHFLVIDEETEEVLIRSWARFDGLLKQPRMAVSYATAYASVASESLRMVLVHETKKIRTQHPELTCWGDKRVSGLLDHPESSAKDLPVPEDPFGDDFGDAFALGLAQTSGRVSTRVCTPPTPAPTPAPTPYSRKTGSPADAGSEIDAEFDTWYAAYPRKRGKGQAAKAYRAARKKATAAQLLSAIKVQGPALIAKGAEFVPYPASWLNGERWLDEPDSNVRRLPGTEDPNAWMRRRPQ